METMSLRKTLHANLPRGSRQVTLFIPSSDRNGHPIAQETWTREALLLLGRLFRGATAFPPGRGVWRNDEQGGTLLEELTVILTSYTNPADHTDENLRELTEFLHRFGREAGQGEVGIVVANEYYGISEYEPAQGKKGSGRSTS